MASAVLDNITQIKKHDPKNMLASLEGLGRQISEVFPQAAALKLPPSYRQVKNILVLAMGGSALGSDVIKSLFKENLKVPIQVVNDYHVPKYVNASTLVLAISYSGTTEEPISAVKETVVKGAKIIVIASGGNLAKWGQENRLPTLLFTTHSNLCGQPRMGVNYMLFAQIVILSKLALINFSNRQINQAIKTYFIYNKKFGIKRLTNKNLAKQISEQTLSRSVWYVGAEHLSGNVHIASNQMNETGKRFSGNFIIPELNHYLMEGMTFPKTNPISLLFILIESKLYDKKIQKRFAITKKVLAKNKIKTISYLCRSKTKLEEVCEVMLLGSYVSFYSAMLEGVDSSKIPFVDFFKRELNK